MEVVEKLRDKYILILATNASRYFIKTVFEAVPIFGESLRYVYSCVSDFKIPRKNRDFYKRILEELHLNPGEVIHVGDDPVYDREEPRSIGVKAFYIDRDGRGDIEKITDILLLFP